ncbi:hypothetical protein BDV97DRAFT_185798 [Delphinella strobiligena]|nr:hypothetical protein BDV97DRAFT_185798 [Delphinella strobiligena]
MREVHQPKKHAWKDRPACPKLHVSSDQTLQHEKHAPAIQVELGLAFSQSPLPQLRPTTASTTKSVGALGPIAQGTQKFASSLCLGHSPATLETSECVKKYALSLLPQRKTHTVSDSELMPLKVDPVNLQTLIKCVPCSSIRAYAGHSITNTEMPHLQLLHNHNTNFLTTLYTSISSSI